MSKRAANAAASSASKKSKQEDGAIVTVTGAASSQPQPAAHSDKMVHSHHGPLPTLAATGIKYIPGFGGEHQSEALPHALPVGQNSPQVSDTTHRDKDTHQNRPRQRDVTNITRQ